jgi:hypothetical protein
MKKNAKKMRWISDMLKALGGPSSNEHEILLDLLTQTEDYKGMWEEAMRSNVLVLPTLDGVASVPPHSTARSPMKSLWIRLKVLVKKYLFVVVNYKLADLLFVIQSYSIIFQSYRCYLALNRIIQSYLYILKRTRDSGPDYHVLPT